MLEEAERKKSHFYHRLTGMPEGIKGQIIRYKQKKYNIFIFEVELFRNIKSSHNINNNIRINIY